MLQHRPSVVILCLGWLVIAMTALAAPLQPTTTDRDPTEAFVAMATAGAAYLNDSAQCPGVVNAMTLQDNLGDFTVIDIRVESAYLAGHIPGAYHSSLATLTDDLAANIPSDKPYVIAGYTGQSEGYAKIAMELLGYGDVYSLLYGMSSWHTSLDYWTGNCGDNLPNPETENQNDNLTEHAFPPLDGDPDTIVEERVAAMLAGGFRGVSYIGIQDNLDDYFIINYFGLVDYLGDGTSGAPGHIPGAFQFTPYQSLGIDQMLSNVPTDRPVVVYGWTGQHSSQVTAYLNLLGYEAYSLKFGANNLFYSELTAHRWNPASVIDLPLETGSGPTAAPDTGPPPVASLGNHPNPFNPATTIAYRLNGAARVTLRIYDLSGQLIRELVGGAEQVAGSHEVTWRGRTGTGRTVASGTYIYRLEAGGHTICRRLTLLK